ncbi:MAG: diacylglycerol kinase family protein [Ilumatobacter fluminis]
MSSPHDGHLISMGTEKRAVVNPERTDAADELVDQVEVDTEQPDDPSKIAERAADAADDPDVDVVAAVGGDGTQRTVAEAIAGSDTELAIVPGGTVNLLGRVHGIETVEDAADAIERGEAHPFDLARCDGHAYLLNSSSGLDAAMIAAVDDRAKRFGRAGYTAMGLLELIRAKPSHVSVVVDGETVFDDDALTVMVLNVGERGSASFRIAPDAATDDGLLDVVVITGSRRAYLRAGWARFRKRLPADADAHFTQGREIEVRWADEVAVQCDGDPVEPRSTIRYTVEPGAVAIRS